LPKPLAQWAIEARHRDAAHDEQPLTVGLKKLREQQRVVTGGHEVLGAIHRELGFARMMDAIGEKVVEKAKRLATAAAKDLLTICASGRSFTGRRSGCAPTC